jgi:hypothetical protein
VIGLLPGRSLRHGSSRCTVCRNTIRDFSVSGGLATSCSPFAFGTTELACSSIMVGTRRRFSVAPVVARHATGRGPPEQRRAVTRPSTTGDPEPVTRSHTAPRGARLSMTTRSVREHRQGRAVRAGVPAHLAQQPHPGHRRRRSVRRTGPPLDLRVGSDPHLPRGEDGPAASLGCEREVRGPPVGASGRWRTRAHGPDRTTTSSSTPASRSPTPSTGT